jgi:hypothetical protein
MGQVRQTYVGRKGKRLQAVAPSDADSLSAPRPQAWHPARNVDAEPLVPRANSAAQCGLLVAQQEKVSRQPDQRSRAPHSRIPQKQARPGYHRHNSDVHGITRIAVETVTTRCLAGKIGTGVRSPSNANRAKESSRAGAASVINPERPGARDSAPEKPAACASAKSTMAPDRQQVAVPVGESIEIPGLAPAFSWGRTSLVKCHPNGIPAQEAGRPAFEFSYT